MYKLWEIGKLPILPIRFHSFFSFSRGSGANGSARGNRNDNVEPNGFTTRGRSARCRICPPIAVMIRCVAVHAWVICYSKVSRTGTWNWNKTPLLSTLCADVLCWFAYADMNLFCSFQRLTRSRNVNQCRCVWFVSCILLWAMQLVN